MIKTNITNQYPNHFNKYKSSNSDIFLADYTNQTKNLDIKRGVETYIGNPPTDINYFTVKNPSLIQVGYIDFENSSFVYGNNQSRSQCECVLFPDNSTNKSWILFVELKYCSNPTNNATDLQKAIKQLYRTRYYYYQKGIINITNTSYMLASLPLQTPPFLGFALNSSDLTKLKQKRNIILKFNNKVEIMSNELISVA